jgi:hypothetical protein
MDTEIETGPTGARLLPLTVLDRAPSASVAAAQRSDA